MLQTIKDSYYSVGNCDAEVNGLSTFVLLTPVPTGLSDFCPVTVVSDGEDHVSYLLDGFH